MGDIADSLIDGEFDFFTGEYIGPGVGYPRTFTGKGIRPVYNHQVIQSPYKKAVWDILFTKGNPYNLSTKKANTLCVEFCINELKLPPEIRINTCYKNISKNTAIFEEWLKNKTQTQ